MEAMIIDRDILPEPIFSIVGANKVNVYKENGNVVLSPVKKNRTMTKKEFHESLARVQAMCSDGRWSSENFIRQKAVEKAMEN